MNSILDEGLMSVSEVVAFLSISRSQVWRLMESQDLPYTNLGRARRIPRTAVKAYAAKSLVIPGHLNL